MVRNNKNYANFVFLKIVLHVFCFTIFAFLFLYYCLVLLENYAPLPTTTFSKEKLNLCHLQELFLMMETHGKR